MRAVFLFTCVLAYNNLGLAYLNLEEFQTAVGYLNKAIELDSNYAMAYYNLGIAYMGLEEFDESIVNYNTAIKLNSSYVGAYYNRGLVYQEQGKRREALEDFRSAASIFEKSGNLTYLQRAQERIEKLQQ